MQISDEGKARFMVIPIVAMLAVTLVVAGWQYEEEDPIEVDVDEGYDEIVIPEEKIPAENEVENHPQNQSVATTYVNNESYLEFEVEPESVMSCEWRRSIFFNFRAKGEFDEDLEIEDFGFLAVETEGGPELNSYDYLSNTANISEGSDWEYSKQHQEPRSFGFDVDSNEFTAEIDYTHSIVRENWEEPHTLELEAIVGGLAEEVSVSIDVHVEGGDEG